MNQAEIKKEEERRHLDKALQLMWSRPHRLSGPDKKILWRYCEIGRTVIMHEKGSMKVCPICGDKVFNRIGGSRVRESKWHCYKCMRDVEPITPREKVDAAAEAPKEEESPTSTGSSVATPPTPPTQPEPSAGTAERSVEWGGASEEESAPAPPEKKAETIWPEATKDLNR